MAKTTVQPDQRPRPGSTSSDDLVPPPSRAPSGTDLTAVAVGVVVLVAAVLFVPGAVTGDVDLDADGGLAPVRGNFAWAADAPGLTSMPLVAGDTVLVGQDVTVAPEPEAAPPATVRAHHVATGAQRWSATFDGPVAVPLTIGAGAALVRTATTIAVVDLDTGEVRWDRRYDPELPPPAVGPGVVLVPGADLVALEADDGEPRWRRRIPVSQPPTVVGDVAFTVAPQAVRALDTSDGEEHWAAALDSPAGFATPPAVVGELVVTGNRLGGLDAFDRVDGRRRWSVETEGGDPVVGLLASGDLVLAGGASGTVHAFRSDDGMPLWTLESGVDLSVPGAVQAAGRLVVVGGPPSGELIVVDRRDGDVRWALETANAVTAPLVVGADLFVARQPGVGPRLDDLVALALDDGRERWRAALGDVAFGMPVPSSEGFLVVASRAPDADAGRLRAVR